MSHVDCGMQVASSNGSMSWWRYGVQKSSKRKLASRGFSQSTTETHTKENFNQYIISSSS